MDHMFGNESLSDARSTDENIPFSHVAGVVSGWSLDFMFLSLCRHFKEGKFDEFIETLTILEAISQSPYLKGELHNEKVMICAFLARVMHGKNLDVPFEENTSVMPLMSAAKIWATLEKTVAEESLFKNITILLIVQSVAVCLEKGQRSSATSALEWFENNLEIPQMETYHPFLTSFSFNRLMETVQSFLDAYLEKNPSDYLLKEATKIVQSSDNMEGFGDMVTPESFLSETIKPAEDKEKKKTACPRTKRKLLSTNSTDVWKPDSCKKSFVSVRRVTLSEISRKTSRKPMNRIEYNTQKARKPPQKWTEKLDKYLEAGVKHHGSGKWSRILMDYDFEGRTGTMLKDRWRVLMKAHKI